MNAAIEALEALRDASNPERECITLQAVNRAIAALRAKAEAAPEAAGQGPCPGFLCKFRHTGGYTHRGCFCGNCGAVFEKCEAAQREWSKDGTAKLLTPNDANRMVERCEGDFCVRSEDAVRMPDGGHWHRGHKQTAGGTADQPQTQRECPVAEAERPAPVAPRPTTTTNDCGGVEGHADDPTGGSRLVSPAKGCAEQSGNSPMVAGQHEGERGVIGEREQRSDLEPPLAGIKPGPQSPLAVPPEPRMPRSFPSPVSGQWSCAVDDVEALHALATRLHAQNAEQAAEIARLRSQLAEANARAEKGQKAPAILSNHGRSA